MDKELDNCVITMSVSPRKEHPAKFILIIDIDLVHAARELGILGITMLVRQG